MPDIALAALEDFAQEVLTLCGVPPEDARIIADSISFAHAHGKGTHGISRLSIYDARLRKGLMQPLTPLNVLSEAPAMALLDAGDGFGQVAAIRGMRRAVDMARICGIAAVGIRNSHNFGTAAFVALQAVQAGMVGMVFSNAAPAIAPTGGHKAVFGTNPLAFGFPTPEGVPPILLDMATSQAARGKIRLAATQGEAIPLGWALDPDGQPTSDAEAALAGSMLPVGGAKGYGLSLMIDVLAGLLTGSGFGGSAKNLNTPDGPSRCGHMLIALDLARFLPRTEYDAHIATLVAATKAAGPEGQIALPGERGARFMQGRDGKVPISDAVLAKLDTLADLAQVRPLNQR